MTGTGPLVSILIGIALGVAYNGGLENFRPAAVPESGRQEADS